VHLCADQQSGQWLVKATYNYTLESGARLKATDARKVPKPVKVALRRRDKVVQNQDELLKWIRYLNPGLQTKHWRVPDKQSEPKGYRRFLHIDRNSHSHKEDQI
jgi:hypothetical protein